MLNINSLNNVRDQKEINRIQIYRKVLHKCHHKIKTIASKGIVSYCFYIVPEYLYGIPKYNTLNCATYIVTKLRNNGFSVSYTYPNLIYISWGHIPSEIKNISINNTTVVNKDPKLIKYPKYRYIEDYKSSKNFLKRIKPN